MTGLWRSGGARGDDGPGGARPVARLLLVEDDDGIAAPLTAALRSAGHEVLRVATGRQALEAMAGGVEAVVLDLGLPDADGVAICRRIRELAPEVPVLILTARSAEADIVVGLDAGADDYMAKPFRLAELLARLRALLRRAGEAPVGAGRPDVLRVQDVTVDLGARRAWRGDAELQLTPKEFDLLALFAANAGRVVTRAHIMAEVWQTTWLGSTKTLDMHVSWLRRKLGDDASRPRYLTTLRGVGFRLEDGRRA